MKIDFTCPAELLNIELADNKCSFYLNNLGEEQIMGAELKLSSFDEEGMLLYEQTIKYHDIVANYHEPIMLDFTIDAEEACSSRELSLEKLWIEGGRTWNVGTANEFTYKLNLLPDGRSLSKLQMIAGKDALCYPEEQGDIWVCVCGRANRIDEDVCRRCNRTKDDIFEKYNKDSVDELATKIKTHQKEEDRHTLQEATAMKDRQQAIAKRVAKRKKRLINIVIATVLLFIAFFMLWYFGVPAYKSMAIDKHMEQGDYIWAKKELASLPDSYDITPRMLECDYNIAKNDLESNTEENLINAIDKFTELGDYEDSAELLLESKYRLGDLYFDAKDYDKALVTFKEIASYSDSGLKITEINYNIAIDKMKSGDLQGAKDILLTLKNYADTENVLMQIDYELGKDAFNNGKLDDALGLFTSADGYSDAEEWYYKTLYTLAEQEFDAKNFEKAGEYYLQVSNNEKASMEYKDAKTKANMCLYEIGKQALANGEYERAANTLYGILDYVNAKSLYAEAIRAIALNHINMGNFDEALAQLSSIDEDEEANKLIYRAKYEKAKSLEESDIEGAIALYKDIQDYNDAGEKYLSLSYKNAERMLADGKYDDAAMAFSQMGEYSDSQERRKECLYAKAKHLQSEDKLLEAKDIFLSLEGYSDSAMLAKSIVLQLANSYIKDKDYQKAIDMLQSIEKSDETDALLFEAKYLIATALIDDNKLDEGMKFLEEIPDFRDSDALLEDVKYRVASEYYSKGDVENAAKLFAELGDYKDSADRAVRAYDTTLETPAMLARQAFADKNYVEAFNNLKNIDLNTLPDKYADLKEIYQKSAYNIANKAYADRDIAKALEIYRSIQDYDDVPDKLNLSSFRIMGRWISEDKTTALIFNEDGSCELNGVTYKHFYVENYKLYVGNEIESMERYFSMSKWDDKAFNARDNNAKKHIYTKFIRSEEPLSQEDNKTISIEPTVTELPSPTAPVPIKLD